VTAVRSTSRSRLTMVPEVVIFSSLVHRFLVHRYSSQQR
jgi:hypothetical protein